MSVNTGAGAGPHAAAWLSSDGPVPSVAAASIKARVPGILGDVARRRAELTGTWLSQDAWTGRWTIRALVGVAQPCRAAELRCQAPLSTTENTRLAEAYGSARMTWSTKAVNGLIPVVGSHLPMTLARWTS